MITNISPTASSADHTLNTLRYADRIKEKTVGSAANAGDYGEIIPSPEEVRDQEKEEIARNRDHIELRLFIYYKKSLFSLPFLL